MQYYQEKREQAFAVLWFFVWPFFAAGLAFKNFRKPWTKNIIWAFTVFFGLTFLIGMGNSGSDIVRYIASFQGLHNVSLSFSGAIHYILGNGKPDFLRRTIAVLLSRFTDSSVALTVVYGIIFGYFYSRNVWFVLERVRGKLKYYSILLLISFLLIIPIWFLNGFRMWTAAHIFIYGIFQYFFNENKKGILISASACLVHYTFLVPFIIFIVYLFIGNRTKLFLIFFVITIFFSNINISFVNNMIESYAPKSIQESTQSYRSPQKVKSYRSSTGSSKVWYASWYNDIFRWIIMGYLVLLYIFRIAYIKRKQILFNLFSFILLFYGIANLLSSFPSGGRFLLVVNVLAVALLILVLQNHSIPQKMKLYSLVVTPGLLLFILVAVRIGFYSIGITTVFGNPIIAFLQHNVPSLNELLKSIV